MTAASAARTGISQSASRQRPRAVAPAPKRNRGFGVAAILAAFALLGASFGLAAFHTVLVEGQYEVTLIDGQTVEREAELLELRLDVAKLQSPDRIRSEAMFNLGLVQAEQTTYLSPSNEAVAEVAAAAKPMPVDEAEHSGS